MITYNNKLSFGGWVESVDGGGAAGGGGLYALRDALSSVPMVVGCSGSSPRLASRAHELPDSVTSHSLFTHDKSRRAHFGLDFPLFGDFKGKNSVFGLFLGGFSHSVGGSAELQSLKVAGMCWFQCAAGEQHAVCAFVS